MKRTVIALLFLLPGGFLVAQERHNQAPQQVQQSFQKQYPDARDTHWSQTSGQWHADFNDQGARGRGEMVAHYDQNGRHIDSHIPYDRHDVPAPVVSGVRQRYHGARDYRFTKIEHDGGEFYQVRVNQRGRNRTVYMDGQGQQRTYNDRH